MICKECGFKAENTKFCVKCGAPMAVNANAPESLGTLCLFLLAFFFGKFSHIFYAANIFEHSL